MAKKQAELARAPVAGAAVRAASDLEELGLACALVGGLAVSTWAEPRYTRDVDFAVGVASDEEAEACVHALTRRGYEVVTVIEHARKKRLATARLRRTADRSVLVDLLFASSGIEGELAAAAVRIEQVPVGRIGHLLALKVLSESERRLQDRIDLQMLGRIAADEDWRIATAMARLIRERGFNRGRALVKRLRQWRRSAGTPA